MKYKIIIILVLTLITGSSKSQTIDFITENFNSVENWTQQCNKFCNNSESYIADTNSNVGIDAIYREIKDFYPEQGSVNWKIDVKTEFTNSSVNRFQIILTANHENTDYEDFEGYGIVTGQKPTYNALSFAKFNGNDIEVLYTFTEKFVSQEITVNRTSSGVWTINGTQVYTDNDKFIDSKFIIVKFKFNKTGMKKFAFKFTEFNQNISSETPETTIDSAELIDNETIRIYYTGRLNSEQPIQNFNLNSLNPNSIEVKSKYIDLKFNNLLTSGDLVLTVNGLKDIYGKTIKDFQNTFSQASQNQIVINEIMCDINPAPFALPANKYIELYNKSENGCNLKNYKLQIGDLEYTFPEITIKPFDYLLITSGKEFTDYGEYVEILEEAKLTISGKFIAIKNELGQILDSLTYNDKMYNNSEKSSGGFSLERIDPENTCNQSNNWKASANISGGTPGKMNSVYAINEDNTAPTIVSSSVTENCIYLITTSEPIKFSNLSVNNTTINNAEINGKSINLNLENYLREGTNNISGTISDFCGNYLNDIMLTFDYSKIKVEKVIAVSENQIWIQFNNQLTEIQEKYFEINNNYPQSAEITSDKFSVLLTSDKNFENNSDINLNIKNIKDIFNSKFQDTTLDVTYHEPEYNDLIINEILYHPNTGGKRFVEFYNNSDYEIFLYGLNFNYLTTDTVKSCTINEMKSLSPNCFLVLTADSSNVKNLYNSGNYFIQNSKFPALDYSKGIITITTSEGTLLDSMYYDDKWQNKFLETTQGVSLERIDFEASTTEKSNWQSCSESYGFATPGLKNSIQQSSEKSETMDYGEGITIENQLFKPGNEDCEFKMTFNFDYPQTTLNISVFDSNGNLKRTLADNLIVTYYDQVTWDGYDNDANRCKTGIYVVLIKAVNSTGWSKTYKKAAVIGKIN